MFDNISMLDKIKWGLIVILLLLTFYNSYQIILIKDTGAPILSDENVVDNRGAKVTPAPTPKLNSIAKIKFNEEIKNFGNVEVNSENKHVFNFTNTGTEPLIISNAKGSCSCTVPNFSKEPVMPGKQGSIEVIYSPKVSQAGQTIEQTVTITSNADPANSFLKIKANVKPQ